MDIEATYNKLSARRGIVQGQFDDIVAALEAKQEELSAIDKGLQGCLQLMSLQAYIEENTG